METDARAAVIKLLDDEMFDEYLLNTLFGLQTIAVEAFLNDPDTVADEVHGKLDFTGLPKAYPDCARRLTDIILGDDPENSLKAMVSAASRGDPAGFPERLRALLETGLPAAPETGLPAAPETGLPAAPPSDPPAV